MLITIILHMQLYQYIYFYMNVHKLFKTMTCIQGVREFDMIILSTDRRHVSQLANLPHLKL